MANPQSRAPEPYTTDTAAQALLERGGSFFGDDGDDEPEEEVEEEGAQAEPEESEEAEDDATEEPSEPAEETASLDTIDDVAKALGVSTEDLLANLKMRVKVRGEDQLVSLSEAQKGYQLEQVVHQKTAEIAEQRRAIQAERETTLSQLHQAANEAAAAVQWAEQMIYAEVNNPAMAELRQSNPAEWVARQQEVQAKLGQLHAVRNQAQSQLANAMQAQQAQQAQYLAQHLEEQARLLKEKVPDWSDDAKSSLAGFLKERYGYNDKEIGGVLDHRLILMARDAMKGAQVAQEVPKVLKKVATLPKVQAPGKAKGPIQVKAKQIAALKGNLKKSGHLRDAAKVIEALL